MSSNAGDYFLGGMRSRVGRRDVLSDYIVLFNEYKMKEAIFVWIDSFDKNSQEAQRNG